ncbi:MAG: citrate synthase 2 [Actinomycetales bacterium]|nr:citrate synthase 2 [Actinomycetales bacterium]
MTDFVPGPAGVSVETEIAEPGGDDGTVRYRGVDLTDLVGRVSFGHVWGLLVEDRFNPGLPPAEPFPLQVRTGDVRVDVQSALAQLAPVWGFRSLLDIDAGRAREDLARASVMALSFVAQAARGPDLPRVPQREIDRASTIVQRFMIRWRGEPDPRHVEAVDIYWITTAEQGADASAMTARMIASTGADVAACLSGAVGAISGPLQTGAPHRVLRLVEAAERGEDATALVRGALDRDGRIAGFRLGEGGTESPRVGVLREAARRLGAPRHEVAVAVEKAALAELRDRRQDREAVTGVEFWAAVLLDFAEVPARLFTPMLACARTAGWAAHVLEQMHHGPQVRHGTRYLGRGPRRPEDVEGWQAMLAEGQVR